MAQYINLGTTCTAFTQENPPSATTLSAVYILDASNFLLKNTPAPTGTGYTSFTGTSNNINYTDLQFKVWFSQDLVRSGTDRQNWRYLSPNSDSIPPTYSTSAPTVNQTVVTFPSSTSWPAQGSLSSLNVQHPAGSYGSYEKIIPESDSNFTTAINNILAWPVISGPTTLDNNQAIYLVKSSTIFLKYVGAIFSTADRSSPAELGPATQFYIQRRINSGVSAQLVLSTTSGGTTTVVPNSIVSLKAGPIWEVIISGSGVSGVDGTYSITTTVPSFGPTEDPTFPTTTTLIKSASTGKYIYWNGNNGGVGTLSLKDYWASGLTSNDIKKGMQFWFRDQTFQRDYTVATPMVDWYRWHVVKNISNSPSTVGNTSNIAVTTGGAPVVEIGGSSTPPATEGWVFSNVQSPYYLMYVRQNAGQMSNVGYLSSGANDTITWTTGNPTLIPANMWICNQCTPAGGQFYCETTGSGTVGGPAVVSSFLITLPSANIIGVTTEGSNVYGLGDTEGVSITDIFKRSKSTGAYVSTSGSSDPFTDQAGISTDGIHIYSLHANQVYRTNFEFITFNFGTTTPIRYLPVGSNGQCIAVDGTYIYIGYSTGSVLRYLKNPPSAGAAPQAFSPTITLQNPVRGIAVDGTYIYTVQNGSAGVGTGINRFNVSSGSVGPFWSITNTNILSVPGAIAISIDSTHMYILTSDGNVLKYDKSTGASVSFTSTTITGIQTPYGISVDDYDIYVSQSRNIIRFNKITGSRS